MASSTKYNETGISPFIQYEFSPLNGLFKGGWSVFDNLRFNFGLRHEDFQQHYQQTTYRTTNSNVGRTIKEDSNNFSRLIKKGGLSFEYQPDHILWFGMADGWLMPNASSNVTATYANANVEPESSITKQLGLRGFFREQGLSYDITAYETNIDDYIGSILCSDNPSACQGWSSLPNFIVRGTGRNAVRTVNTAKTTAAYTGNAGKVTARGFETALSFQPHEMIKFDVAHTLTWNIWNTYNAGAVKLSGVTLVNSPKHHVNGRITVFPVEGLRV